jgi:hypothetical protein
MKNYIIVNDSEVINLKGLLDFFSSPVRCDSPFGAIPSRKSSIQQKISVILDTGIMIGFFSYIIDLQHFNILNYLFFLLLFDSYQVLKID